MKKITILLLMIIALYPVNVRASVPRTMSVKVYGHGKRYRADVYWRSDKIASYKFNRKPKIKFVPANKLTYKMLVTRRNKVLYIEYFTGTQLNADGDGAIDINSYYNYVSYRRCGFHTGDKIRTYCVYNPYTNYVDDISERYDELIK